MMALSATRQFGDPSTHFIPYLVKAGSCIAWRERAEKVVC